MVVECCVCKRRRQGDHWVAYQQNSALDAKTLVSHGYCPECAAKAVREISEYMVDAGFAASPVESISSSPEAKRVSPAA
jgi:hypothetical protein